ncbi:hypothetical protein CHUAL_006991 [Chamberlinius hualienensis]
MFFIWLSLIFLNLSCILGQSTYNILMLTSPVASRSHSIYFNGIAKQLALQGHKVVHRCAGKVDNFEGITNYVESDYLSQQFLTNVAFNGDTFNGFITVLLKVVQIIFNSINVTYNEPLIFDIIQQPFDPVSNKSKYDVVLIDLFFGEMFLPLAHIMKVPAILMVSSVLMSPYAWNLNVPYYYFFNYNGYEEPLNFIARIRTFVFHFYLMVFGNCYFYPKEDEIIGKRIPNVPSVKSLMSQSSLILTANPPSIQDTLPMTSNIVDIGCAHCRPPVSLPKDLEAIMQNSNEHGVIYFSMGSFVKNEWIPEEFLNKIVSVLKQLPQTILWKGKSEFKNVSNFYVSDWFPQQDLLAHPKLRLVINNGGLGTMQEASYHGCPILGFPLNVDHYYAMKIAKKEDTENVYIGERLQLQNFYKQ